ncbi:S-adenosyl-L-methionine-dependent methyltransferase [Aspergillus pseudoustus]|uniref:S-adenosyl-L-methionine-dependent methyltransferase n=1 Tax=Aspergillus pseudoustus TaxID=1810923 RepID=A0ABR4KGD4_9EURO
MEALFQQVKDEYAKSDENGKRRIQGQIRDLQVSLLSDWDVVMQLNSAPLQVALTKIAIDLDIFRTLKESESPVSLAQLAEKTGAASGLLARILRFLAAFRLVRETGPQEYTNSALTDVFCNPSASAMVSYFFDVSGPCTQALPNFFADNGYQEPSSLKDCPFQKGFRTEQSIFEWLPQNPKQLKWLGQTMALERPTVWVDHFPLLEYLGDFAAADKTLFVDVGGSIGHQAKALREKFPTLPGKVIVQDLPGVVAEAPPTEGVEFVGFDFFNPQPVQGAKFYYLRHVFHNWTDQYAVEILKQIVPALGKDSIILIDDLLIPPTEMAWQAGFLDLAMMGMLAGIERTRAQFDALVDQAGLKITETFPYDVNQGAILVVVPK